MRATRRKKTPAADVPKVQRIRDPIHDLVVFELGDDIDSLAWRLLDCSEFQRLRRIRQLGFSELVYPGATHSRLAHCIGAFHTARQLLRVLRRWGKHDPDRALVSSCAALLHDVGHGPFSHVFEGVIKELPSFKKNLQEMSGIYGKKKVHEIITSKIVSESTHINRTLRNINDKLPEKISKLILSEDPEDIYSSVVASQFDDDRLDYLRRDKYMCGVGIGGIDFSWLLQNLIVADILPSIEGSRGVGEPIPWLVLSPKASEAAEGYLLARYQLYSTIYYHKTTRSAEKMLTVVLKKFAETLSETKLASLDISASNPVVAFLKGEKLDVETYLRVDDSSVWALLSELAVLKDSAHRQLADLAQRLLSRKLFKAFDISGRVDRHRDTAVQFLSQLRSRASDLGLVWDETLIQDRPSQTGYDWYDWDSPSSLKRVLVHDIERNENIDIGASPIVQGLKERQFIRVYVPDKDAWQKVDKLWKERIEHH